MPSLACGFRAAATAGDEAVEFDADEAASADTDAAGQDASAEEPQVVSLDAFRKRKD